MKWDIKMKQNVKKEIVELLLFFAGIAIVVLIFLFIDSRAQVEDLQEQIKHKTESCQNDVSFHLKNSEGWRVSFKDCKAHREDLKKTLKKVWNKQKELLEDYSELYEDYAECKRSCCSLLFKEEN